MHLNFLKCKFVQNLSERGYYLLKFKLMNDTQLLSQISSLPNDLKKEVSDFIEFLKQRSSTKKKLTEREFGHAKGFFKMSSDFDEPLDDFKDYR
jgi:hypothetical protein